MPWLIKHNGVVFDSDDFTIADLGEIEKATDVPWSIANPLREIKVARAFLAVALLRSGRTDKEVEKALALITLKALKRSFELVPEVDKGESPEVDDSDPLSEGSTFHSSSSTAPGAVGHPLSPESSV